MERGEKGPEGWAKLHPWISGYLHDKTTPRKVVQWHAWAHKKLESGWSSEMVEERIREAWREWSFSHDTRELEPDLLAALQQVFAAASSGWTPAQCAVVYRSLARAYPTRDWLSQWAQRWENAGDDWQNVVMP